MELLQVAQAGVACAKVVDSQPDPHLIQLLEQGDCLVIRHQQLPFGQLEHHHHLAGGKVMEKGAAFAEQGEVVAVGRTDVEADVKAIRQLCLHPPQLVRHASHHLAGHGHDKAGLLRLGNEEIGADHPLGGMVPAHQHLSSHHAAVIAGDQRLQIGDELPGAQGPFQLVIGGARTPQHPPHQPGEQRGCDHQ